VRSICFQLTPSESLPKPAASARGRTPAGLAGLVRLEAGTAFARGNRRGPARLHPLQPQRSAGPGLGGGAAAGCRLRGDAPDHRVANLQLGWNSAISTIRLDGSLATTYGMIHELANSRLPFWHSQARSLRALGELRGRGPTACSSAPGNVLKLVVGDQYLARVLSPAGGPFHLEEWERSILRQARRCRGGVPGRLRSDRYVPQRGVSGDCRGVADFAGDHRRDFPALSIYVWHALRYSEGRA